jgi:hypothetical protein
MKTYDDFTLTRVEPSIWEAFQELREKSAFQEL